MASFSLPDSLPLDPHPTYAAYAARVDRIGPHVTGSKDSWLAIAEQGGADGIRRRLMDLWQEGQQPSESPPHTHEGEPEILASQYFQFRLRPVLTAHVIALAVRAEGEAERRSYQEWLTAKTWQEKRRELNGRARLCGTWQWTVHNHKNHQDHKITMVFPPPDGATALGGGPAKIIVLGDNVYLRWEFHGGYQEDSLLFAGEGQRLEGTFTNSGGAWGSITGKRTAACGR
jgi:hypothetical protein